MAGKSMSPEEISGKLLQGSFTRPGPSVERLADPIAPTAMVLTIEEMIPYEHNPRKMTNSKYEELKASIRARGLDQPPPVTRRPGQLKYIIRNGGNTRLQILRELWNETKDERFFKINVLFRPWDSARGEIIALTGHLAENDLQGQLMFIERAVGVDHARQIYEEEAGEPISQRELSRRLEADGYPISQSHLSKMQEAIRTLLPVIPTALYSGLGKPQIEKLLSLRKGAALTWEGISQQTTNPVDFEVIFQDVLCQFDSDASEFVFERFQDELIGTMKSGTRMTYEQVLLDITEHQGRARRSAPLEVSVYQNRAPIQTESHAATPPNEQGSAAHLNEQTNDAGATNQSGAPIRREPSKQPEPAKTQKIDATSTASELRTESKLSPEEQAERIAGHVVTPVATTSRVQGIKQQLAALDGETLPDFNSNALISIPVQAGGLHPISDVWYIEREIDWPTELRRVSAQLAREIAEVSELGGSYVVEVPGGIGFICNEPPEEMELSPIAINTLTLLQALSGVYAIALSTPDPDQPLNISEFEFTAALGQLLMGQPAYDTCPPSMLGRISDAATVKLFRLIRLGRRLVELESKDASEPRP
ncbi:ParB family protein [Pseudomonas sp. NPDC088368]|uniref:ParB family protein n=1 Tax=Pseudomonas sp. NPDC088368 TaxID=3364453 RepID=UPI003804EABB